VSAPGGAKGGVNGSANTSAIDGPLDRPGVDAAGGADRGPSGDPRRRRFGPRSRAYALTALLIAAIAWAAGLGARWETDNRLARWGGASLADPDYEALVERFGGDELVLVRALLPADSAPERIAAAAQLADLPDALRALPGRGELLAPLELPGLSGGDLAERLAALANRPLARCLGLATALSDGTLALDHVLTIEPNAGPAERRELAQRLAVLAETSAARGLPLLCAGHPLVAAALDAEALRVQRRFAPLLVVVAALAGFALWRSIGLVAAVLLPALLCSVGIQALLHLMGHPSNMILVAVGPLVLVLMLAAQAHGASAYAAQRRAGVPAALALHAAWRQVLPGVALAGATTAVGFLVFLSSPVSAVRELGLAVGLTIAVGLPLAYALMPILLVGLAPAPPPPVALGRWPWRKLAIAGLRRPLALGLCCAALLLFGALAPAYTPAGGDSLGFFPEAHPVRRDFLAIEAAGGALSSVEVLLPGRFGAATRPALAAFARQLERSPGAVAVFGPGDVAADLEASGLAGAALALALPPALRRAGRADAAGELLRFSVRIADQGGANLARLAAEAGQVAAAAAAEHGLGAPRVTGSVALVIRLQSELVRTLATSLAGTALVSLLAFLLATRRPRPLLAAALANAVPVAGVLFATWALGFRLDAATVMVASVVLGLAVDNTFHLLHAGRLAPGEQTLPAGLRALDRIGPAAAFSTAALVAGFGVLSLAGFAPTARFGGLCALGSLLAFGADFLVLPWIWLGRAPIPPAERRG
jgi:hypothetical protein